MATITSVVGGSVSVGIPWSNPSSWSGGVVPTALDDVILAFGAFILIDVDITVKSLTVGAASTFVTSNRNITLTGNGLFSNDEASYNDYGRIEFRGSNITCNFTGIIVGSTNKACLRVTGAGVTLNVNSSAQANGTNHQNSSRTPAIVLVNGANCTVNYTGTVTNGSNTTSTDLAVFYVSSAGCVFNILGVVTNGTYATFNSINDTVATINGTLMGSNSVSFRMITNLNARLTINGILTQNTNVSLFYTSRLTVAPSTTIITDSANLYTADLLTGYPPEAKVEDGTVYGPSSEFEGTLEPWDATFAQALATAQRDLQLPSILSAITAP